MKRMKDYDGMQVVMSRGNLYKVIPLPKSIVVGTLFAPLANRWPQKLFRQMQV
jgi:hypothetical protein